MSGYRLTARIGVWPVCIRHSRQHGLRNEVESENFTSCNGEYPRDSDNSQVATLLPNDSGQNNTKKSHKNRLAYLRFRCMLRSRTMVHGPRLLNLCLPLTDSRAGKFHSQLK